MHMHGVQISLIHLSPQSFQKYFVYVYIKNITIDIQKEKKFSTPSLSMWIILWSGEWGNPTLDCDAKYLLYLFQIRKP